MADSIVPIGYDPPMIRDYGSLADLTEGTVLAEVTHFARFGVAFAASVVGNPNTPGGGGVPNVPVPDVASNSPSPGDVLPGASGGGGPSGASGGVNVVGGSGAAPPGNGTAGVGATGGGGLASGNLPFTGFAVSLV